MFEDEDYRWCEDVIEALSPAEARKFLMRDAREMIDHDEWEVAYGILRELVWRFPDEWEGWSLVSQMATRLGKNDEADEARRRSFERRSGR
jgi:hypothetical protein